MDNYAFPSEYNDTESILNKYRNNDENYWLKLGEERALELFHRMAQRVPAYKDFLYKNRIDHSKINSIKDFSNVPLIDKNNYLRAYPRSSLCWDGDISSKRWTIASTTGSTGEPYYFPREAAQDKQYAFAAEAYLLTNFDIDKKSTLYINAFPMGVWIGGLYTYEAIKRVGVRGRYKLSIINPGINKIEIIKIIKNLGNEFEQIIIGSYAPFLKDIIDDGIRDNLNWKDYRLGFVFSAEGFTETFRDYVYSKTGVLNTYNASLNHYGTVDLGTMSHETPLSIYARRTALSNEKLYDDIFGNINKLPTLTQYNPHLFYFEDLSGKLICSAYSGLPLVRYDLKDNGGIISHKKMISIFDKYGHNIIDDLIKLKLSKTLWQLPFVYVYERSDFSISFYAFQIYPETIRRTLQLPKYEDLLTGKFTMEVNYDLHGQQVFEVNVELKAGKTQTEDLAKDVSVSIKSKLLAENSEYRKTTEEYGDKTTPVIKLWTYESSPYFTPGIKQKWVKK